MDINNSKKIKKLIEMIKSNATNVQKKEGESKETLIILKSTNEEIASAAIECMVDVIIKKVGPNYINSNKSWSLMVDCSKKISNSKDLK